MNAVVPRDSNYGAVIDWTNAATMDRFEKVWGKQTVSTEMHGFTHTEICSKLGAGDLDRGDANLKIGLKKGDIEIKEGHFFFKRIVAKEETGKEWGEVFEAGSEPQQRWRRVQ